MQVVARHYLDHASTSPIRPTAAAAMAEWLTSPLAADAGRAHTEGHATRTVIEEARERTADALGVRPREIVFTSGATEAIAAAVWGAVERRPHVVVAAVEHSAVRRSSEAFGPVTVVGCDAAGRIDPDEVLGAVGPDTGLVHVQFGNHEVGTLQPVAEIVAACRERGVLVHVDAAAAAAAFTTVASVGADLVSLSAHKMGGPPGIGALLVRRGLRVRPLLAGGDQERARRAGLENTPAIVGWAAALADLQANGDREAREARRLTARVVRAAPGIAGVTVVGDALDRLGHIVCLTVEGVEPQAVLLGLDQRGIAAHSGSACSSEAWEPSPVLEAMGVDAHHSLRVSVGWNSSDADIDALLEALPDVLARLRALRTG